MNTAPSIAGFGACLPPRVVTNEELSTYVDTNSEWIISRTGIAERRFAAEGVMASDLAAEAARDTLVKAGRRAEELTHIIFATCTPDVQCPASACLLEHKLGLKGLVTFDVNSACSGFLSALDIARAYTYIHPAACILVVAAETLSHRCNWEDRSTAVLFADGAGAAIVTGAKTPPPSLPALASARLLDTALSSDGSLGELLVVGGGLTHPAYKLGDTIGPEYFLRMQGREVFKHAVRSMDAICRDLLQRNGLTTDDIDVLVPHQANLRIIEAVGARLEVPAAKTFVNVQKYGNTSAASIPIALYEALNEGAIKAGDTVLLVTFGGGLTWGAGLLQF